MENKVPNNELAKLIFGIIMIFLLNICSSKKQGEDWDKENLMGKIKIFTQTSYKAEEKNGIIEKGIMERREWDNDFQKVFDKYGNIVEEYIYGVKGDVVTKIIYNYEVI